MSAKKTTPNESKWWSPEPVAGVQYETAWCQRCQTDSSHILTAIGPRCVICGTPAHKSRAACDGRR